MRPNKPQSKSQQDELDEILRSYFREVVDKAVEANGENIVEFAERSKAIRNKTTQALQSYIDKAVTSELEYLYDYATSGTRVKTLLGHRISELRGEEQ